jgi:hypothetical protein
LLGWRAVGYVEWEPYCQAVIAARIKDGLLEEAPIFGDIREFVKSGAAREYRGFADVVSAGFPCQPHSAAGRRLGGQTSETCGQRRRIPFAQFNLAGSGLRMSQESLIEDISFQCWVTWPRWGFMRDGECFQLLERVRLISASGGSVRPIIPTISKNEFKGTSKKRFRGSPHYRGAKAAEGLRTCESDPIYLSPLFGEWMMGWPIMWTVLAPLATAKFQQWLHAHGRS